MNLPEITEVQRLTLRPGDRIIIRVADPLDMATAAWLVQHVREALRLPPETGVVVLVKGITLDVLDPVDAQALVREITR